MGMSVKGTRRERRPRRRWMDSADVDLRETRLSGEERQNRSVFRLFFKYINPAQKWEKTRWKQKTRTSLNMQKQIAAVSIQCHLHMDTEKYMAYLILVGHTTILSTPIFIIS